MKKVTVKKVRAKSVLKKSTALSVPKRDTTLSLNNIEDVGWIGKHLKDYIVKNELSVKIGDNQYAMVDGWKYAANYFGLKYIPTTPIEKHLKGEYIRILYHQVEKIGRGGPYLVEKTLFVGFNHDTEIIKDVRGQFKVSRELIKPFFSYECGCDLIKVSNGEIISHGTGLCSNMELLKVGFDGYAVSSMSETRAIGKAIRNPLGFVMKSAGMETTPAEEMTPDMRDEFKEANVVATAPVVDADKFKAIRKMVKEGMDVQTVKREYPGLSEEQLETLQTILDAKQD